METMPAAVELVDAAIEALRSEVLPDLEGRAAFQCRVIANVLEIVSRELREAPAADVAEHQRLAVLLSRAGVPDPALGAAAIPADPPAPWRSALCDAIRDGRVDLTTPGLGEHLWADVLARVAIEQPRYPSFLRETAAAPSRPPQSSSVVPEPR